MTDVWKSFQAFLSAKRSYHMDDENTSLISWKDIFSDEKVIENMEWTCEQIELYQNKFHIPVFPSPPLVFNAFYMTPLCNVKCVIIGQDPYYTCDKYGKPDATGMCFSLNVHKRPVNSSLRNIYEEVKRNVPGFVVPDHGYIANWAAQGCLLLNKALTVPFNKPKEHLGFWVKFITFVIEAIRRYAPKACFVLWGNDAKEVAKQLGNGAKIFESGHPSGLSVRFFQNNQHFRLVNEYLVSEGMEPIDWTIDRNDV